LKAIGWLLGLVAFGGLIVLSVAGLTAAIGILVTAAALVGMIALGNLLGGRTTPNRPPYEPGGEAATSVGYAEEAAELSRDHQVEDPEDPDNDEPIHHVEDMESRSADGATPES